MEPDKRRLRDRLRRYERKLAGEKRRFGFYNDGYGKRYFLGPLYLLLGDLEGALRSFTWFETEFPDDSGDPGQYLCWTLALYRASRETEAIEKLKQTALRNLYVVPHLLGDAPQELDIWHGSNLEEPEYVEHIPPEYFLLWEGAEKDWARRVYKSPSVSGVVERWIEIHAELNGLPPGWKRSRLVDEASALCRPSQRP